MNTTNNNDDLLNDDPEQSSRRNITKSDDMLDYELEDPDDILNDDVDDFIDEDMDYSDSNSPYDENDADAVFDRQEKDKKRSNIIRRIILLISVAVFIFAAYNLINIFLAYHKADVIYNDIEQNVLDEDSHTNVIIGDEEEEVEVPFKYNHQALLNINSDGLGYIYIPSIGCRLPMVQGNDNDYYLTHTFDKQSSANGCLFEDSRINSGLSSNHVIIYGHNMRNGAMFGKLKSYENSSFYNGSGNNVFYIYTGNVIKQYKIFSCYISEAVSDTYTFNFPSLASMQSYAADMKAKSLYDTGVDISSASQVVTLSTCTDNGEKRFIVHGMYIGEASLK